MAEFPLFVPNDDAIPRDVPDAALANRTVGVERSVVQVFDSVHDLDGLAVRGREDGRSRGGGLTNVREVKVTVGRALVRRHPDVRE